MQAGEKGLQLGATETENQGLAGFRAPTLRRLPGNRFAPLNGRIRLSRVWGANSHHRRRLFPGKRFAPLNGRIRLSEVWGANPHSRRRLFPAKGLRLSTVAEGFPGCEAQTPSAAVPFPGKMFAPLNGRIRLSRVWGANPHRNEAQTPGSKAPHTHGRRLNPSIPAGRPYKNSAGDESVHRRHH